MAGPRAWRSLCRNSPPAGEDELAGDTPRASTNDNGTFSQILAVSHVAALAPALPLASAKLMAKYTNADLQRATKLASELFV